MQIAQNVDIIFISVKPQYVGVVIKEMKPHLTGKHIMVSIAAGIPLSVMKVCFAQI
jgi:pyrroline-5-carboxylate reductase